MFELLNSDFSQLHLLRPLALLGLIPALIAVALAQWRKRSAGNWEKIINPALLPYLMQGESNKKQRGMLWVLLAWIIACLAVAGPSWQQLPQPVHKKDAALILIMDLSPSMLAEDVKPSRLERARYKLIDILKNRSEGFSALVVYGGAAYTLTPLTEDSNTIISLVPVLHPTLLPEYGSNTEDAIETALELAISGGYQQGDLLLITDEVSQSAFNSIQSMISRAGKFRLSILGVGTQQGAPIPTGAGGFAKDRNGAIIIPKLSPASLQILAQNNGGIYAGMSADDSDIEAFLATTEELFPDATTELERSFDLWDDQGFWLAFLLLPIIVLSFRKGNIAMILLAPLLFSDPASALGWQDLWKTADQQASEALANGDAAAAQSLFKDPEWRGSAAYKAGDYETAINQFVDFDDADSHYNRGNALAHSGDLDAAIEAYDQALALNPEMEDAEANKELLEQLKQEQEQQQQDSDSSDDSEDSDSEQSQDQDSQSQDSESQDQQSQDQQQSDSQESEAKEGETEQSEEPKSEEERQREQEEQQRQEQKAHEPAKEPTEEPIKEPELSEAEKQAQKELEQWLRRVPDDPGGLLREKFRYQSRQRALERRRPVPPNNEQQERW
ncbi:VWA domain-containing protein [SAR92 clade bacterium H455]|uniref:VWA domain-containing protein n=1 Tax=SAR92 clade bacterium H455 TaxID=2974818 RepID=A0ABY5TSF3_9GAMM|nr:VWA domain-containing protein [SAR92 clade bacterium H455]